MGREFWAANDDCCIPGSWDTNSAVACIPFSGTERTMQGSYRIPALFVALAAASLGACGGGGDEDHGCTGPAVASSPPTVVSVNSTYVYGPYAPYSCSVLGLIPGTCVADVVVLLEGPSGAHVIGNRTVEWTPTQANIDARFVIATSTSDTNCRLPTQSWTVHVNP